LPGDENPDENVHGDGRCLILNEVGIGMLNSSLGRAGFSFRWIEFEIVLTPYQRAHPSRNVLFCPPKIYVVQSRRPGHRPIEGQREESGLCHRFNLPDENFIAIGEISICVQ
jgi:hypothetical protein